ncbi:hypothetical protein [Companilactobacillus hulinensis]|uniref:hypothetical protein n=1 Tax=Companilactobacillus hulinensis TaxID=2486007 RepID=UPI000F7AB309|nr:hypothetical protein [Companilactobacillus hulinensis]
MDKIKFVIADKALKYIESLNNDVQGKIFSSVDFIVNNGFTKKSNKIPLKELKHAEKLRHDYLNKGING